MDAIQESLLQLQQLFTQRMDAYQARPSIAALPPAEEESKPAVIPKPPDLFKPAEDFEKPAFIPPHPKPIPHSPKISPSSIPNPSPSISTNKPPETGYPNYGGYLYSIPGYSAFQPVSYPSMVQPNPGPIQPDPVKQDFTPIAPVVPPPVTEPTEKPNVEVKPKENEAKPQDFEQHFTPEIIPAVSNSDIQKNETESKMSITSLAQGSGATVTIPNPAHKDVKKKTERFSLKTSIPISKIDMKCMSTSVDTSSQTAIKKPVFNPAFQKDAERPRVEIQSNIVIKIAGKEIDSKEKLISTSPNNSISTLLNAAEEINKADNEFKIPEPKGEPPYEVNKPASPAPQTAVIQRPMFNPMNLDKPNFCNKPPEGGYNEQKSSAVYSQNKASQPQINPQNPQNPQILLQRTNFESKNLQVPSRLSSQSKKSKEDIVADSGSSSKVVSLKRLHQDDCDENDFENLITENQIYGNKIVVKEKSQGIQQEQDIKNKSKDKQTQSECKNVVLQSNVVYMSNVQFPANLMVIKNNSKTCQTTDSYKTKLSPNENKTAEGLPPLPITNGSDNNQVRNLKPQNMPSKDLQILKSSNNVLQSLSNNNNNKMDVILTNNPKLIVEPQLYQMVTSSDNKNSALKELPKIGENKPKKELPKLVEIKPNDKMIITCQYKVDAKLQPKLVITNFKTKMASKVDEVSTLDIYEKRKRLRRLKYLSNNNKEVPKIENRKCLDKFVRTKSFVVPDSRNIITPDKLESEIFKEFVSSKEKRAKVCNVPEDSDSDYGEDELMEYTSIIEEYGRSEQNKMEFLSGLRLTTHQVYREKEQEKYDRVLKFDSVATAYIASGKMERQSEDRVAAPSPAFEEVPPCKDAPSDVVLHSKQKFLSQLSLRRVSRQYKEAHERSWRTVLKDRRKRNGIVDPKTDSESESFSSQLKLLTEIKHCVNENNNLIKKRLDPSDVDAGDIRVLAEKNFSELNRLSKMADRSIKLFSGQETRKRDLNPGFDSENIKKAPIKDYPKINIPSIASILSLKGQAPVAAPASSMDEPRGRATGADHTVMEKTRDFECQVGDSFPWPGVEAFVNSYREYRRSRSMEINELHRRNTALRVQCAHVTRRSAREADRARALTAERQRLAREEAALCDSLHRLCGAVDAIRALY